MTRWAQVRWTRELSDAARNLSRCTYDDGSTIPERAREMIHMRPGDILNPMQLDCVAMLRSRMHTDTPAELAFNEAWSTAWAAANVPDDAQFDYAVKPRPGFHGDR